MSLADDSFLLESMNYRDCDCCPDDVFYAASGFSVQAKFGTGFPNGESIANHPPGIGSEFEPGYYQEIVVVEERQVQTFSTITNQWSNNGTCERRTTYYYEGPSVIEDISDRERKIETDDGCDFNDDPHKRSFFLRFYTESAEGYIEERDIVEFARQKAEASEWKALIDIPGNTVQGSGYGGGYFGGYAKKLRWKMGYSLEDFGNNLDIPFFCVDVDDLVFNVSGIEFKVEESVNGFEVTQSVDVEGEAPAHRTEEEPPRTIHGSWSEIAWRELPFERDVYWNFDQNYSRINLHNICEQIIP